MFNSICKTSDSIRKMSDLICKASNSICPICSIRFVKFLIRFAKCPTRSVNAQMRRSQHNRHKNITHGIRAAFVTRTTLDHRPISQWVKGRQRPYVCHIICIHVRRRPIKERSVSRSPSKFPILKRFH